VLVLLAEYGAFEILGYQTFTTEIFTEASALFDIPAACALSLVLIALGLAMLASETALRGHGRVSRTGPLAQRVTPRHRLGLWTLPALAGLAALVALALGAVGPAGS
jgi:iron(III) transport system permease protein